MYKTKQMEDIKMKKSNLLAVLTAATMAMTMAVPMGMPADITGTTVMAKEKVTEGRCGDNATYSYDAETKTLTINGTGEMWDDTGFAKSLEDTKTIVINKGITSIGSSSFCDLYHVEKVELADTVSTIKSEAFNEINGTFVIPASVAKVETNAIRWAKKIVIQGDMKNYAYAALGNGADEIEVGGTADSLGYALAGVYEYDDFSVTISKNNTACKISNGCLMSADSKTVYYYVSGKNKVTIPDAVLTIKPAAFYQKNIKEVALGKNVKTIGEYAFYDSYVSKLTLNANLKTIGRCAFTRTKLKEVTLKSSVALKPAAFDSKVKIYSTKSLKKSKTVVTSAKITKNKVSVKFCKLAGAKGYQVQIKKGGKTYKYFTAKNSFNVKTPKVLKGTYNVKFSYDLGKYTANVEGKPAYVSVRPYKILKNKKKSYGKWSEKMILSK